MKVSRILKAGAMALSACVVLGGCVVSAQPARSAVYQQEPLYHDGYVVHFDTVGQPYVYAGRSPRYVSRRHPRYRDLISHRPRRHRQHNHYY